jgi:hypothetical protein
LGAGRDPRLKSPIVRDYSHAAAAFLPLQAEMIGGP